MKFLRVRRSDSKERLSTSNRADISETVARLIAFSDEIRCITVIWSTFSPFGTDMDRASVRLSYALHRYREDASGTTGHADPD